MSETARRLLGDPCILCHNDGEVWMSGRMVPCLCDHVATANRRLHERVEELEERLAMTQPPAEAMTTEQRDYGEILYTVMPRHDGWPERSWQSQGELRQDWYRRSAQRFIAAYESDHTAAQARGAAIEAAAQLAVTILHPLLMPDILPTPSWCVSQARRASDVLRAALHSADAAQAGTGE